MKSKEEGTSSSDDGSENSNNDESSSEEKEAEVWTCPEPTTEEELKQAVQALKGNRNIPRPPKPKMPSFKASTSSKIKIAGFQKYIDSFQYNMTGTRYFRTDKRKGMHYITSVSRRICRECLPIQCLEATFLGIFLTTSMPDVERIPVSFKSKVDGHVFRHIVLAIHCTKSNKWGAIGISRKKTLAYKALEFDSFGSLILDYKTAYEKSWHELLKVYVGLPFSHDPYCGTRLHWRVVRFRVDRHPWKRISDALNEYGDECTSLMKKFYRPSSPKKKGSSVFAKFCLDGDELDSDDEIATSKKEEEEEEDTKTSSSSIPKLPPVVKSSVSTTKENVVEKKSGTAGGSSSCDATLYLEVVDNKPTTRDDEIIIPPTPAVGANTIGTSFLGV